MPDQTPSMPPLPGALLPLIRGAAQCTGPAEDVQMAYITAEIHAYAKAVADERVREAQQWRPIKTAPRDGTHIIAFRPADPPHIEGMYWATYEDADRPGGWHWSYDGDAPRENPPTHWMPMPPGPTLSLDGADRHTLQGGD